MTNLDPEQLANLPAADSNSVTSDGKLPLGTQLFRFVATGGLSAVVDFGLLFVGQTLGLGHALAKALSWVAGTATAYAINRRWTFQSDGSSKRFVAVMGTYLATFVVQVGLYAWLYPVLLTVPALASGLVGAMSGAMIVGFVVAQGVATTVNFIVQRWLIFK